MSTEILTHTEDAQARSLEQFKTKPNWLFAIAASVDQIQDLEVAAHDVLTERTIDNAVGEQLNVLGRIVGQARGGLSDADYRRHIRARIRTNRSKGTMEDLITVTRLVIGDDTVDVIPAESDYNTVIVETSGTLLTDSTAEIVSTFLHQAKAGGVRVLFFPRVHDDVLLLGPLAVVTSPLVTVGASTFFVGSTDGFPDSGDAQFVGGTVDSFAYTSKTDTAFIGCSGIGSIHTSGERIVIINDDDHGLADYPATTGGQMDDVFEGTY